MLPKGRDNQAQQRPMSSAGTFGIPERVGPHGHPSLFPRTDVLRSTGLAAMTNAEMYYWLRR